MINLVKYWIRNALCNATPEFEITYFGYICEYLYTNVIGESWPHAAADASVGKIPFRFPYYLMNYYRFSLIKLLQTIEMTKNKSIVCLSSRRRLKKSTRNKWYPPFANLIIVLGLCSMYFTFRVCVCSVHKTSDAWQCGQSKCRLGSGDCRLLE